MIEITNEFIIVSGYKVHPDGTVISPSGRALKPQQIDGRGYVAVWLGSKKRKKLHRLIAEAFLPNPNGYAEVNHKDGNKKNNHVSNLEWCSREQNMRHAVSSGLHKMKSGELSGHSKLKQTEVDYIRSVYIPRHHLYGQSALGRKFGVSNSCVFRVISGDNW